MRTDLHFSILMPTALKTANYKAAVLSGVAESILAINCTNHFDFTMYGGLFQVVIIPVKEIVYLL